MRPKELRRVLRDLGPQRRVFHYYEDRFALDLLGWAFGEGAPIARVRRSRWGRLLDRDGVRPLLAAAGDGRLHGPALRQRRGRPAARFLVSFTGWGNFGRRHWTSRQVSRRGENLVVQLDFSPARPGREPAPVRFPNAPLHFGGERTLGWSRIDVDRRHGEALIEEVQSDWAELAEEFLALARQYWLSQKPHVFRRWLRRRGLAIEPLELHDYLQEFVQRHIRWWAEVILCAALGVLVEDLGVRRFFFHTPESGVTLKHIHYREPPRSVYTQLPRRFCFAPTDDLPRMLSHIPREHRRGRCKEWRLQLLEL